jgi:Zn-dependent protease with chaperone function
MDFFEHQEVAQKKTGRLVLLFCLAVLGVIVFVYVVVAAVLASQTEAALWWDWRLFLGVGAGVTAVVGLSSLYKISSLSGGGHTVATMMNGRLLEPNSRDPIERKVLNVVEEMGIASGTPAPPVYLMAEEDGINAFAAGYSPNDAVIGVTRGCVEKLSRDELQGVIAHEFSHILNGDMRLNIRLMGAVFGILVIGIIGWHVLRTAAFTRSRSDRGGGAVVVLAVALALVVVGFIGTFFGKCIQAAVSRQREYLADASAVQFTRNPDGISGALKKIGGFKRGSKMHNGHTDEISHMLFSQGLSGFFGSLLATHPPLKERIQRVDASFDGRFAEIPDLKRPHPAPGLAAAGVSHLSGISQIGQPTKEHVRHARQLTENLPPGLKSAAHEAYGARAVVYALLTSAESSARERQLEQLKAHADPNVYEETLRLLAAVKELNPNARLPLIDMACPALRELSPEQFAVFRSNVTGLIRADGKLDIFEWALSQALLRRLAANFGKKRWLPQHYSLKRLQRPCATLLSALTHVGHATLEEARSAFAEAARNLPLEGLSLAAPEECSLDALDEALRVLCTVKPRLKKQILTACAISVSADGNVTVTEGELLRGIADSLDCPMPPLLPGQPLVSPAAKEPS